MNIYIAESIKVGAARDIRAHAFCDVQARTLNFLVGEFTSNLADSLAVLPCSQHVHIFRLSPLWYSVHPLRHEHANGEVHPADLELGAPVEVASGLGSIR